VISGSNPAPALTGNSGFVISLEMAQW